MRSSARGLSLLLVFGLSLSAKAGLGQPNGGKTQPATTAQPETAPAAAPSDARGRAKVLFEKGAAAYAAGRYFEAIDIFLETQRVYPTPLLSFNIAKAYDNAGSESSALRHYRDYLRGAANASDAGEVEARVRELEATLAERGLRQLTVISVPEGATVLIDEQPVGVTPFTTETAPGKYLLTLSHSGYEDRTSVLELDGSESAELSVELQKKPIFAPPAAVAPPAEANWPTNRVGTLTWTSLAVGGAALAGALVVEATTRDGERGFTRGGAFLAGVGTAFTLTGGALLCLDLCSSSSEGEARVAFSVGPNAGSAALHTSF